MQSYEIPRNYKGEGRILFVFSAKAFIYTAVGIALGLFFYFIFNMIGLKMIGIILTLLCGGIGFVIGTFKMPEIKNFEITRKTGGENIDDVLKRWFKFKTGKKKIYVYKEEVTKDE